MTIRSKQLGLIYYDPTKAYNGYTLFAPASPGSGDKTYLIDMEGRIVHLWDLGGWVRYHMELLPNGHIFGGRYERDKPVATMIFLGGELFEMDWDGNVVWRYDDPEMDLHDRSLLANGNIMIMKHADIPKDIEKKVRGGIPGSENDYGFGKMHGFVLQEIDREGKVDNEFELFRKLDPKVDVIPAYGTRGVWPGTNSLEELSNGNMVTTSYNMNNIYIWDRQTGDVKWRWGDGILAFPHDPTELDNGNILVHDNQRYPTAWMPPDGSRVIEVNPKTNEIEWQFRAENPTDFHNTYIGSNQRLPNGNTLVCSGARGHFFEVTPDGEVVWEFVSPFFYRYSTASIDLGDSIAVFRCYRFGPDYPGLQGKDLDPGRYANVNNLYGLTGVSSGRVSVSSSGPQAVVSMGSQAAPGLGQPGGEDKVSARAKMLGY